MQTWHYLDNSATTPLCEEAKSAMLEAMEVFGNPSSLHGAGQEASRLLARARRVLRTRWVSAARCREN